MIPLRMKNQEEVMESRSLRPSGVEREYGIDEGTLANWRSQGIGPPFVRLTARQILYLRSDLEDFFESRKVIPERVK